MIRIVIIVMSLVVLIQPVMAQLGDFQLGNANNTRQHETVAADPDLKGSGVKYFFIGKGYRMEWIQPVMVPVLKLNSDFGGLTPEKEGGGKQTHTLHIKDGAGNEWVLRSVRKFPEGVIPKVFEGTIAEKILEDGLAGSYPYSVLSHGTLAKAAAVPFLPNTLVFIPDHPALGEYREKYKNTLALLESRKIENESKTYGSEELVPKLLETSKNVIDQVATLRARILDNFIMDFDRHEGQWIWVEKDSGDRKYYYPVPKDRDQTFFKLEGLLPKLASKAQATGPIEGFKEHVRNIYNFNYSARDFDRTFLNQLDEQTWNYELDKFLASMTDKVIESALEKQPIETQKLNADGIVKTLKGRRNYLKQELMDYYRFISETVSVTGSNEDELFTVTRNADGTVTVDVNRMDSIGAPSSSIYHRLFVPTVTKELRLNGLEGNDRFVVKGDASDIKVRMIGGPGKDNFTNEGNGNGLYAYDVSFEENNITGTGIKNKISDDPMNNEYSRLGTKYNSSSPGVSIEYSEDGGIFLGPTYTIKKTGFRKEPYAMRQFFYATRAISTPSYHLRYDADYIKVGPKTDLLFRSDAKLPTVRTRFFGYGNNSIYDQSKGNEYYLASYQLADLSFMARHPLTSAFTLKYGPVAQYFKLVESRNKIRYVGSLYPSDFDKHPLYEGQFYAGGEVRAEINTRNSELIPTRGFRSNLSTRVLAGLGSEANSVTTIGGDFSFYTDFLMKDHIIVAASFGAGHNFGDFQFPQAQYLGNRQNLRGLEYQRFAGRSKAYNNTELRINFGDLNLYFVKGPFGILGFHDIGRVWMDNEQSDTWHSGYGGGLWMAPFNKIVITGVLAGSKEERMQPQVTFGFQF